MSANEFIHTIFRFLKEVNLCFLYGSIVLDDEDGKIFLDLYTDVDNPSTEAPDIYAKLRPTGRMGTHKTFLKQENFLGARKNSYSSDYELYTEHTTLRQYEKILDPKITYLCDPACRQRETQECKSVRSPKGVILFYPFQAHVPDNPMSLKRFIFMKLEGYVHNDIKHMKQAVNRYILRKEKADKYPKRREDEKMSDIYLQDKETMLRYIVTHFDIVDREFIKAVTAKIDFYNDNIRTGNEIYLPSEIISHLRQEQVDDFYAHELTDNGMLFLTHEQCMKAGYISRNRLNKKFTKEELHVIARTMKIPVPEGATKAQLCEALTLDRVDNYDSDSDL